MPPSTMWKRPCASRARAFAEDSRSSISMLMPNSRKYPRSMPSSVDPLETERACPMRMVVSAGAAPDKATSRRLVTSIRSICRSPAVKLLTRLDDKISPLRIAAEILLRPDRLERPHHLAAVAAADRRHQLLEEFRAVRERRLDRRKARAGKA